MASQLLIATFSSREEMLRAFDALTMKHTNHIKHAAVISRPNENEVVIMDDDLSPDEGAIAGSAEELARLKREERARSRAVTWGPPTDAHLDALRRELG